MKLFSALLLLFSATTFAEFAFPARDVPISELQDRDLLPDTGKPINPSCVAVRRPNSVGTCGEIGHLHPHMRGWVKYNIDFQNCANLCVCKTQQCHSFSWHSPTNSRMGICHTYGFFLAELHFAPNSTAKRIFYDRTCYNQGKPTSTSTMSPKALGARFAAPTGQALPARDVELVDGVLDAMI